MKKERERRLRVSSYKSRNKTAFCQNFCTGAVRGRGTMNGCGDVEGWARKGRRANVCGHFAFGSEESRDKGEDNGLERVRFVRFWAEKNAPLSE